jgi:Ser/Thr protein kinase RdoA (MazF antagonist)
LTRYESLGRRGQIGRLRRLGRSALAAYGLGGAGLTPLRHEHNTTFRVYARGGPYVLRINRPGVHTTQTIGSEMAWLRALRRDTGLGVPEPVAARDGSLVVVADDPRVPEPRVCVLLRWLEGRFVDARLTPGHLRRAARLQAELHMHARGWSPPDGFRRPRLDMLTSQEKAGGVALSFDGGDRPSRGDADRALRLVAELAPPGGSETFAAALETVWATTRELEQQPDSAGLIHGDLHQENYCFHDGEARAIDFDDCGWGYFLYDLAVTLSEIEGRLRYDELRFALLDEYSRFDPLPERAEVHLAAFSVLRRMQLLMWGLESRHHPAFRDTWQAWAREDLRVIADALDARP